MHLLFVYGTLKRGCKNHRQLADQRFVGEACTAPGYRLYDLGDYPGLVTDTTATDGVSGEIWEVDAAALIKLDEFEGVAEGLYRRIEVKLRAPIEQAATFTYLYARDPGRLRIGPTWHETSA